MYWNVPRIVPCAVIAWGGVVGIMVALLTVRAGAVLARPKSSSLAIGGAEAPAATHKEDIAGFQIAMDDPLPVGRGQRVGHLDRDPQRFVER